MYCPVGVVDQLACQIGMVKEVHHVVGMIPIVRIGVRTRAGSSYCANVTREFYDFGPLVEEITMRTVWYR